MKNLGLYSAVEGAGNKKNSNSNSGGIQALSLSAGLGKGSTQGSILSTNYTGNTQSNQPTTNANSQKTTNTRTNTKTPTQSSKATGSANAGNSGAAKSVATPVTISDWNSVRTGYIINGETYYDPEGTQRILPGTEVWTDDGKKWVKTEDGSQLYEDFIAPYKPFLDSLYADGSSQRVQASIGTSVGQSANQSGSGSNVSVNQDGEIVSGTTSPELDYYDDLISKLEEMYNAEVARGDTLYANQIAAAKDALQKQRDAVNLDYDDIAKQLYIDRRMQEKNAPEQLAIMGYNGGLSESSLLDIGYNYEQNLANSESARVRELAEALYAYNEAERAAADTKAQSETESARNYMEYYIQMQQAKEQAELAWAEIQLAREKLEWEKQQAAASASSGSSSGHSSVDDLSGLYGVSASTTPSAAKKLSSYYSTPSKTYDALENYEPDRSISEDSYVNSFYENVGSKTPTTGLPTASDILASRLPSTSVATATAAQRAAATNSLNAAKGVLAYVNSGANKKDIESAINQGVNTGAISKTDGIVLKSILSTK